MLVWRVVRKARAAQALSGEGARLNGGRWNHVGIPVVYTSESLSLAVLEYVVHVSIPDLPKELVSVRIDIPDKLPRTAITADELPDGWRTSRVKAKLRDIGTHWARGGASPIVVVPSVVIPNELNYILNPNHPLASSVKVVSVEPLALDRRLY